MSEAAGHPRGSAAEVRLARLGFRDPPRALAALTALALWGDDGPVDPAADAVVQAVADSADPDLAARSLQALAEGVVDRAALLGALRDRPGSRLRLTAVLGASAALGEHLVRHPADWSVLADDDAIRVRPSGWGLARQLCVAVGATGATGAAGGASRARGAGADVVDDLRSAYRRCLLGLAARDLTGQVTVEEAAGELADLAAAALQAALAISAAGLPDGVAPCRLAVVAMGKCGGRELNYVSDVDVVFVGEPVGIRDTEAALRSATLLAEGLMRVASVPGREPPLWPIDAALRPEGRLGPLVRSLASHEAYYRRWARTWEFQALLKARPVAGDLALGEAYVERLAPLMWAAAERPDFVADVQAMRRRVVRALPGREAGRELKLGPGGLRDVEFAVQLLQLVHGRADESLRSGSTLVALESLAAGGYVGRDDAARLAAAYRFLRTAEHRLQLQRLRRTHLMPIEPAGLRWLARAMGYRADSRGDPVVVLASERALHDREVRRLHEKLFYRPLLDAVARLPAGETRLLSPQAARSRLAALGFADPAGALRHLEALTGGVTRPAAIQRTLLPVMLGWFADSADPDAGLLAFRQVSEALGHTPWYLGALRDEGAAAERLARVLASSRYAADLLVRAPEGVRILGYDAELAPRSRAQLDEALLSAVRRRDDWEGAVTAARGLRRQELLRIAGGDLLGRLDIAEVGRALSDVAGATIAAAFETATRKVGAEWRCALPMRLAVIAMGRLGGCEQGYGSDADVLFVHEPCDGADESSAARAAHEVASELRRLLSLPGPERPLHVDADLRPEGRQGPLTRSLAAYAAYYERWALGWEAQALLRARPLAGDASLGERFVALVDPVRWPCGGLDDAAVVEIRRLKARVEAERLPRGADPATHTKLGRGGLADVEWTVQLLALRYASAVPALRTTSTLAGLSAARDAGLLSYDDAAVLDTAWRLAARVRNALVLVTGKPTDSLPTGGRQLAGVARSLGYPAGEAVGLVEDYRRATRRARVVVNRVFYA